jgi:hypothetical protein
MLKLRHEADASADHYQVYSGTVRVGTIYKTSGNPSGNSWFWGLNGVENGPGPFNGRPNARGCQGQVCCLLARLAQGCRAERRHAHSAAQRLGFRSYLIYICCMPKRSPREKLFEWRVTRIRATPARLIGYVQAPDAEKAAKEAIAWYGIDNPQEQARLAAQRVKEIG